MSNQENTETTDSAPGVEQRFRLALGFDVPEFTNMKCGNCKQVSPHQWIKIQPNTIGSVDETPEFIMEMLKMTKRLLLCQNCGNLRLTN